MGIESIEKNKNLSPKAGIESAIPDML